MKNKQKNYSQDAKTKIMSVNFSQISTRIKVQQLIRLLTPHQGHKRSFANI